MRKLVPFIIALQFLVSACAQNDVRNTSNNLDENYITVNQPPNNKNQDLTREQVAQHLVQIANQVPNVHDATAVVVGNYAVVGIDVGEELDRSRVGSIKYSVAESLKDDPLGANAVVVADADSFERLNKMRDEINNGRPIEGIMEELAGIVGRLMPQVPADINTNKTGPTKQNDEQLPQNEEKQLDQIQNKQSKNNMRNM
ncbi:YhcN/YlaJ family sporulation lipoprotein [Calidifontibacillus oryziterrae]|uniref:YhcN/YlaJ family sporulation lipoprotein n=1 Tax=Calidifontibacillus oryziterrae TaxID=1191699 RepID=UPI000312DE45|nr:YhcN/YlaJ family sporulation lipoprotein [Calidifontibacillus oryziterrae]